MNKQFKAGDFHRLLAKAHRLHYKRSSSELATIGITHGQPRVMHYLSEHDGCIQKDISSNYDLEPATVTDILSLMEKAGLIHRESDPEDRRVLRVFLTDKGSQTHEKVESIFVTIEKECFNGFSAQEKKQTFLFLDRIYNNLKTMEIPESK